MKRWIPALVMTAFGCGGDDGSDVEVRAATAAECPTGGAALVKDGQTFSACDGTDGEPGVMGAVGTAGERGPAGTPGAPGPVGASAAASDILTDTILCQSNDGTTFLTGYIWVMADGDAVGICTINEAGTQYSSTSPIIGTGCALESVVQQGLVTVDFSTNPPTLGGVFVGNMACL